MTDEEKWLFLEHAPMLDAAHPIIRKLALDLSDASRSEFRFACLAMTVARDWIRQTSDVNRTGGEDIAGLTRPPEADDAVDALRRGEDDCDAKARLFCALMLAAGYKARMAPRWSNTAITPTTPLGKTLTHVSAEFLYMGKWQPVELTLARAKLGELGEEVPKEISNGRWKLA